jgi:hypothetical protein
MKRRNLLTKLCVAVQVWKGQVVCVKVMGSEFALSFELEYHCYGPI